MKSLLRFPTTIGVTAVFIMFAVVTDIIPGPISEVFVTDNNWQLVGNTLIATLLLTIGERLMGSVRAIWIYLIGGVVGVSAGVGAQYIFNVMGDLWSLGTAPYELFDPVAPALAVTLAASAFATRLWRRRIRVVVIALAVLFASYASVPSDLYRLSCAVVGLCMGILLVRGGAHQPLDVSPRISRRRFLATMTGVAALGPLLALFRPSGLSPLSILSSIATGELINPQSVLETCGLGSVAACERGLLIISNHGSGTSILSFVPVALLLLSAWGMARGRRFAMWLGIIVNVVLSTIALISLNIPGLISSISARGGQAPQLAEFGLAVVLAVLLPLAVAVVLFINRDVFSVSVSPSVLRQFGYVVGGAFTFLFSALVFWSIAFSAPTQFTPTPWYYVAGTLKRFLPGRMFDQPRALLVPHDVVGWILYQWVGPAFWMLFIVMAIRVFLASQPFAHETRFDRMAELVKRGGSSLSYMSLWPGNAYWVSADGEAGVAYRVIRGVAITLAEPLCAPGEELRRIHEFTSYCDRHHWTPVFYSVHENLVPHFETLGWQSAPVGQESHIDLASIDLNSKDWQKIRHAHNRAGREEVTALWTTWHDLTHTQQRQVDAIAEAWASTRNIPEMGFTLGTAAQLRDPNVGLMLAVDSAERIHGITSWLPIYRHGVVVGWTLDFMRRSDEGFPGVMEFLIGATALKMKEDGLEQLSLSGVPLAKKPAGKSDDAAANTVLDRLQSFLSRRLEPAYGFASLMFFKAKFHPRYETLYMAYPDPVALPQIARAIGRAYLPDITTGGALKLLWRLRNN